MLDLKSGDPKYYKIFKVPKYRHKKLIGWRIIEEPIQPLKEKQRELLKEFEKIKLSPHAYGVTGKSALQNAELHEGKDVVIQIDIQDFYRSTTKTMVQFALPLGTFKDLDYCFIVDPVSGKRHLPTGAPTSSILANLSMKWRDEQLAGLAIGYGMTYSRYMDDLTFSGDYHPKGFIQKVKSYLSPYKINWKKYQSVHTGYQQAEITGVVINGEVPTVSRDKRRVIRTKLDHLARESKELDESIIGELNYVRSINEEQYHSLAIHYERRVKFYGGQSEQAVCSRDSSTST